MLLMFRGLCEIPLVDKRSFNQINAGVYEWHLLVSTHRHHSPPAGTSSCWGIWVYMHIEHSTFNRCRSSKNQAKTCALHSVVVDACEPGTGADLSIVFNRPSNIAGIAVPWMHPDTHSQSADVNDKQLRTAYLLLPPLYWWPSEFAVTFKTEETNAGMQNPWTLEWVRGWGKRNQCWHAFDISAHITAHTWKAYWACMKVCEATWVNWSRLVASWLTQYIRLLLASPRHCCLLWIKHSRCRCVGKIFSTVFAGSQHAFGAQKFCLVFSSLQNQRMRSMSKIWSAACTHKTR